MLNLELGTWNPNKNGPNVAIFIGMYCIDYDKNARLDKHDLECNS